MQQPMFQPDHNTSVADRRMDEIHVQQFAALADEFISVLDQLQSVRLPAYRLTLVCELQRIYEEALDLRTAHEKHAEHEDSLTFA